MYPKIELYSSLNRKARQVKAAREQHARMLCEHVKNGVGAIVEALHSWTQRTSLLRTPRGFRAVRMPRASVRRLWVGRCRRRAFRDIYPRTPSGFLALSVLSARSLPRFADSASPVPEQVAAQRIADCREKATRHTCFKRFEFERKKEKIPRYLYEGGESCYF